MTREQLRLAVADSLFIALWLVMNLFWMWESYVVAIPLAAPAALCAIAALWWTERNAVAICITGSNVAWFLKDFFWMMENSGSMPSGVRWGTACFVACFACIIAALFIGAGAGVLATTLERLKRIRMLFLRR